MSRTRVLLVEDSATVRHRLLEVLAGDPELELAGQAVDGRAAIELCQSLRPDVLSLDLVLPLLSGLSVTEYVMAYCPTPILIVSASTNRGSLFRLYDALAAGAVDILEKPYGQESDADWNRRYRAALKMVARIRVIPRAGVRRPGVCPGPRPAGAPPRAVGLGASTGGPHAVLEILRSLPAAFPLPILVVVHIASPFGAGLAEWLDGQCRLPVRLAAEGERLPEPGCPAVLLAPPDRHLYLRGRELWLSSDAPREFSRPSVDVLFESMARELGPRAIAGLLTGMGKDGARGLRAVRDAGGLTLAQDRASATVFGMPQEAIRLDAAQWVLPLGAIAGHLSLLAGQGGANA